MKSLLLSVMLLFLFINKGDAQRTVSDSLNQLLSGAKQDTSRVLLLIHLSRGYLYSKPDTCLQLAQTGLQLARKIKFVRGEALCLRMIGTVIGLTGNYPKSLATLLQALKLDESIKNMPGVANCNINIGNNYNDQGEYSQSIFYYLNAKLIEEDIHNDELLLVTLVNLGDSYEKSDKLDSARINTEQGYELAVRLKSIEFQGVALNNLGNIYSKMGQDDIALGYYRKSLSDNESAGNDDVLCETTLGMARIFKKAIQIDSALIYARQSLSVAKQSGFTKRVLDASYFLSAFYENIHLIDSAYAYQKITVGAKDSLFSQEKERELRNLSFAEQTRQQEIAEATTEAIETRRKNIQMAGIGVFIPIFFGIILFFSRRKIKSRSFGFMGLLGLLLLFEFIALLIHPYIEEWTHSTPVLMLLILVAVASILVPLHHKLEHWVKEKLIHNHKAAPAF
jgi:tetratricopeptide (TPR) repeat protein